MCGDARGKYLGLVLSFHLYIGPNDGSLVSCVWEGRLVQLR